MLVSFSSSVLKEETNLSEYIKNHTSAFEQSMVDEKYKEFCDKNEQYTWNDKDINKILNNKDYLKALIEFSPYRRYNNESRCFYQNTSNYKSFIPELNFQKTLKYMKPQPNEIGYFNRILKMNSFVIDEALINTNEPKLTSYYDEPEGVTCHGILTTQGYNLYVENEQVLMFSVLQYVKYFHSKFWFNLSFDFSNFIICQFYEYDDAAPYFSFEVMRNISKKEAAQQGTKFNGLFGETYHFPQEKDKPIEFNYKYTDIQNTAYLLLLLFSFPGLANDPNGSDEAFYKIKMISKAEALELLLSKVQEREDSEPELAQKMMGMYQAVVHMANNKKRNTYPTIETLIEIFNGRLPANKFKLLI
jgi:hypothetical protein